MKLNLTALTGDTWEGALLAQQAKDSLIEEQIALGHMMRLEDCRVVITLAGCNAYQAELDAENERLLNSLVAFPRNRKS